MRATDAASPETSGNEAQQEIQIRNRPPVLQLLNRAQGPTQLPCVMHLPIDLQEARSWGHWSNRGPRRSKEVQEEAAAQQEKERA